MKTFTLILLSALLLTGCFGKHFDIETAQMMTNHVALPPAPASAAFTVNAIQAPPPIVTSYAVMTMPPYYNPNPGTYFLQSSTDFVTWTLIATNELDQPLTVTDAIPSPLKFYRTGFGSLTAQ